MRLWRWADISAARRPEGSEAQRSLLHCRAEIEPAWRRSMLRARHRRLQVPTRKRTASSPCGLGLGRLSEDSSTRFPPMVSTTLTTHPNTMWREPIEAALSILLHVVERRDFDPVANSQHVL